MCLKTHPITKLELAFKSQSDSLVKGLFYYLHVTGTVLRQKRQSLDDILSFVINPVLYLFAGLHHQVHAENLETGLPQGCGDRDMFRMQESSYHRWQPQLVFRPRRKKVGDSMVFSFRALH